MTARCVVLHIHMHSGPESIREQHFKLVELGLPLRYLNGLAETDYAMEVNLKAVGIDEIHLG